MKTFPHSLEKWVILALQFITASIIHAQKNSTLVLWHADGTQTRIELLKQPQVTFDGDMICFNSPVLNLQYPASNVLKFTYEGLTTAISDPQAELSFHQDGERILFDSSVKPSSIALYTADGARVPVSLQSTANGAVLSLSGIPSGVYFLSVNGKTSKFMKR